MTRRKRSIALDLKSADAVSLLLALLAKADVLLDPYRPGVLEALGLAPTELIAANPRLIVARLAGFRRDGPYADMAGHDINYLAVSGVLSQLGRSNGPPYAPANILADFAGGGLMCAFGVLAALLSRAQTGKGQVVEANMVDGSAYLGSFVRFARKTPMGNQPRGENLLDMGCPFYDVYECRCGGYMAVGALEPKFFKILVSRLGLDLGWVGRQYNREDWQALREDLRQVLRQRSRREWEEVFIGQDACCTPVLGQTELEEQGYEQRSAVALHDSPSLPIDKESMWHGQGLAPGEGGEELLSAWMGWKKGRDYALENGGLIKSNPSKL